MLYYGFFVIFTGGLLLAIYLFLAIKWFATHSWCPGTGGAPMGENSDGRKIIELGASTTFKYIIKEGSNQEEYCAVCLSKYEEGEEVRELPMCKHSFHAPCIDKWFCSYFRCPLCRAPMGVNLLQSQNSREELSDAGDIV